MSTVSPSRDDPVAHGVSTIIGGPIGTHARRTPPRWFLAPLALILLLTSVNFGLGYLQKKPCRDHAWSSGYQYTRLCYTDPWALYFAEGLDVGKVPYRDEAVEYPPLVGGTMWVAAKAADAPGPGGNPKRFFDITAALLLGCALAVTVGVVRSSGRRPWDGALFALAPTLLLHGLTSWDLVAVSFATLGIAAWSKRWPVVAGVCIGLGISAQLYPVLFLIPLLALAYRTRLYREMTRLVAGTVAAVLAVNIPAFFFSARILDPAARCHGLVDPERAWWAFYNKDRCAGADWDSIWYSIANRVGAVGLFGKNSSFSFDPSTLNTATAVLFVLVMSGIVTLAVNAPRRPRLAQLLFLTVAAFLLVNKVWSPQFVLWLVPLAVLARPRWRMFLAWQAAEVFLTFIRYYYLLKGDGARRDPPVTMGLPLEWLLSAVVVRDVVLIALMVLVAREIRYPHLDVVRRHGVDDPAGGVFDGASDRDDLPLAPEQPALVSA